jgi:GT2 family glycosyltransferase
MREKYACDIVIPVYDKAELTLGCLKSIISHTDSPYRIILIDNGSGDAARSMLGDFARSRDNVTLIRNEENLGWVRAVNQGIAASRAPYVCVMNNDTVVETRGWLARMISVAEIAGDIGLVNPGFGECEDAPVVPGPFVEIDFCRGYCILIKRSVIDRIGSLDEAYGLGYYDDDDYSVRAIRSGFRCVRASKVTVRHLRDSTFSTIFADEKRRELHRKNRELFYKKWGRRLRLVFIIGGGVERDKARELLLLLARRQHIVYLWNLASPLDIAHINVRERAVWRRAPAIFFASGLWMNRLKKAAKRYDIVFTGDARLARILRRLTFGLVRIEAFDMEKDAARAVETVDSLAKA